MSEHEFDRMLDGPVVPKTSPPERMATPAQVRFMHDLQEERDYEKDEDLKNLFGQFMADELTFSQASQAITRLQDCSKIVEKGTPGRLFVTYDFERRSWLDGGRFPIPAGRFALDTRDDPRFANEVSFFHLWIGSRRGWRLHLRKGNEDIEISRGTQVAMCMRIAEDPKAALLLYGKEIGRCGICGSELTNDESRAKGIGPICEQKLGF